MVKAPSIIPMSDASKAISRDDIAPTILPDAFLSSPIAQKALAFSLPRFDSLPHVALYRDQVITYVEQLFSPLSGCIDGPWLTGPMINNYVKSGLIPAPVKKQYGHEQVARLIVITVFKQFLPMTAIKRLFSIQRLTYPVDMAYDYVATELEHALHTAFAQEMYVEDTASMVTRESLLVRSAVAAYASKTYLLGYLHFYGLED